MPVNPHPVLLPPAAVQIRRNVLPRLDPLVQLKHLGVLPTLPHAPHRHRERKEEPVQALPEHQIRIRQSPPVQPPRPAAPDLRARPAVQHALKVAEELRETVGGVVGGFSLRFGLLLFVVGGYGDGVVRVVRFVAQSVQGGERELVDVVHGVLVRAGAAQVQPRSEVEEDVGRLADAYVAVL